MSLSISKTLRLKALLDDLPPEFIVDTAWLKGRGIDSKFIHNYVKQGWIKRVVRGVYQHPLPHQEESEELSWQVVLLSLQQLMGYDVHLGGRDALDQSGFVHFLMLGKWQYIHFYGNVPSWLNRLPTTDKIIVQRSTLFGGDSVGIIDHYSPEFNREWTANVWQWPIRISSPERAILELIARLRRNSDFEYVSKYFESLIELRPKLLMMLLKACRSIKKETVFRLC